MESQDTLSIGDKSKSLPKDEKFEANKILDKYIKELKDLSLHKDTSFVQKLGEVEKFLDEWDIRDKIISVFELAGDYFFSVNDYCKSSVYYDKAKELTNGKDSINILRKLSRVYFYMGNYEKNIRCCEFALDYFNDMSEEYRSIFLFNSALCYMGIKDYHKAIENLTKVESIIKSIDINKYYQTLVQKAICLEKLKEYKESLDIYSEAINILKDNHTEEYILVLANMLELFRDSCDYDNARKTLKKITTDIIKIKDSKHLSDICLDIAKTFKWLKDYDNAEKYCLKALEFAKEYEHYFRIHDIFTELTDIGAVTLKD